MIWAFFGVVAVGLVGVFAALISGRWSLDPMAEPAGSTPEAVLPPGDPAHAIDTLRFDTALRGYRMDQVDDVLDELRDTISQQAATIAALRRASDSAPEALDAPAPEPADTPADASAAEPVSESDGAGRDR